MIVVSGALVLVALIFLIIGLLGDGLTMIWVSIGTSIVAGVFLLLGALQRRGAPTPAAETSSGPDMLERVTAVSVRPRETDAPTESFAAPVAAPAAESASAGEVSVVPGRPRYHVASCRFLAGRPDVETVDVESARSDGYTACGVCKPDAALEAAAAAPAEPEPAFAEPAQEITADTSMEDLGEPLASPGAPKKAPAKRTRTAAATAATAAPAKKATAAKSAAAKSTTAQVVVIPDRGKFHTETCRFVKDVPGTLTLTKPTAKRQGYVACGVCKP